MPALSPKEVPAYRGPTHCTSHFFQPPTSKISFLCSREPTSHDNLDNSNRSTQFGKMASTYASPDILSLNP